MLLEVKNLFKNFGSVVAAENINFSMGNNEVIGIIGSNGAGKTTFCNIITGYTKPDKGEIKFKGKDISYKSVLEIKKQNFPIAHNNMQQYKLITYYPIIIL